MLVDTSELLSCFFALGALCATYAAKLFCHLLAAKCRYLSAQSSHIAAGTNINVAKVCVRVDMLGSSVSLAPNVKNRMRKYK